MSVYVCFGGIVSKVRSEWNLISKSLLKSPEVPPCRQADMSRRPSDERSVFPQL